MRPFDSDWSPLARLRDAPLGDVLAARSCALSLLSEAGAGGMDDLKRLVLTTACILLQTSGDDNMGLAALLATLDRLEHAGPHQIELTSNPSQMTRYTTAELLEGKPVRTARAIAACRIDVHRAAVRRTP